MGNENRFGEKLPYITKAQEQYLMDREESKKYTNAFRHYLQLIEKWKKELESHIYGEVCSLFQKSQRERVAEYFEESVDSEIRAGLGRGFLFRPYYASEKYDRKKKLVPEFPIRELFGKNLPEEFEHGL